MKRRRLGKYSLKFRQQAVARMRICDNVQELAKELDVHRALLYRWRDQLAPEQRADREQEPASREKRLEAEIQQLKGALADKTLEVDFFKGALQKVAARRQSSGAPGGTASTTRSGSGCPCKAN